DASGTAPKGDCEVRNLQLPQDHLPCAVDLSSPWPTETSIFLRLGLRALSRPGARSAWGRPGLAAQAAAAHFVRRTALPIPAASLTVGAAMAAAGGLALGTGDQGLCGSGSPT